MPVISSSEQVLGGAYPLLDVISPTPGTLGVCVVPGCYGLRVF
jgi:hypothetical protein